MSIRRLAGGTRGEARPSVAWRRALALSVATICLLEGCTAGWHQPPELSHGPLAPRQQVEVWQGGEVQRWHAVTVSADSISGVHFLNPIDCASCRIALPRSAVDSVRLGDPTAGFLKSVGLGLGILVGSAFIICAVEECPGKDYD